MMDITVVGIPARYRDELKESLRQAVETRAKSLQLPLGAKIHIRMYSPFGTEQPLLFAFDGAPEVVAARLRLANAIAAVCADHSCKNKWWYRGYEIKNLLSS